MRTLLNTAFPLLVLTLSACSTTPRTPVYEVQAKVHDVERAPEVCRAEHKKSSGNTLLGLVVGGVVGNQFGSGNGRVLATLTGAAVGAAVAAPDKRRTGKLKCKRNGYRAVVSYLHPETDRLITTVVPLTSNTRAKYIIIPVKGLTRVESKE